MKNFLLLTFLLAVSTVLKAFTIEGLRTEYSQTPLGIDNFHPRFSWQMNDKARGALQKAYQITVKDEYGAEMWNSGKINSDVALGVHYGGNDLKPRTRYTWTVTVWNNNNDTSTATSWFETGLKSYFENDKEWGGAQWIGGRSYDAYTFYSQYLPVFRLDFTVQIDQKTRSTQAGIIYGANDIRLMDKNKNILGVENGKNESYIKLVLNIAPLLKGGEAQIDIYRVGYTPEDKVDVPFSSTKIPKRILNKNNCYRKHTVMISSMCGTTTVWLDIWANKVVDGVNINPMGKGGDYIAFPVVGDVGFYVPAKQKAFYQTANIHNFRHQWHCLSTFANNLTVNGKTTFLTPEEHGAPMLRTEFDTNGKQVAKARLYATARGIYEMFVNGKRVSDDYLNPGLTQYNKTLFYQTYDVTNLLKSGKNAMGAQLNEGWWSGAISFSPDNWNFFGDRQALMAELILTYTDGTEQRIVTNPMTWKYTCDGPVRIGSLFQGEVYDATKDAEYADWAQPGYNTAKWKQAVTVPLEEVISKAQSDMWPTPDDYSLSYLQAQIGDPVHQFTTITAQGVKEVRPGVFVYDMGQNMAGVPEITFTGLQPGTKVYMRYAEVTYPDLPQYKDNVGMVMMENQRAAMEQDIYIAKGGTETFNPRYTYHGFRYIEITGIPSALPANNVKGIVLSSVDSLASDYETSNNDVNRFFKNVQWSTLANCFSIPTDCPQRNERMGWSGDLSVFSPSMSYIFNGPQFLRRHLQALRDTQLKNGDYPAIAPIGGGFGGPLWASVGITMPWQSYVQYGDVDALAEHYQSMKKFIDLYTTKYIDKNQGSFNYTDGTGLGDWLGFEVNKNDNSLLFDCYLVHELDIMTKAAKALSEKDDIQKFQELRKQRAKFINEHYINKENGLTTGSKLIDTQTSYALPIAFNIVDSTMKDKFVADFLNTISRQSIGDDGKTYPAYSLMTGFIGTAWISQALSECGHSDYAYKMLENTNFPSWLYPVEQGATTIWERLNSYTKQDGFGGNNHMNSFNHYAFGSVTNWLMQYSLGIARDETSPGFKHFFLKPEPDTAGGLTEARGHYDSMYGRIESCWHISGNKLTYRCTVPANTTATLYLPVTNAKFDKKGRLKSNILLDGQPYKTWSKQLYPLFKDGKMQIELQAGEYDFQVE